MVTPSIFRRGSTSIRTQLVALVLIVTLPLIGLVFGYIALGLKREQQQARERAHHIAEGLARRLDERHRAMGLLLETLRAAQSDVQTFDCASLLSRQHGLHAHLALRIEDATGLPACGGGELPRGAPVLTVRLTDSSGEVVGFAHAAVDTLPLLEASRDSLGGAAVAGIIDRSGAVVARLPLIDASVPNRLGQIWKRKDTSKRHLDVTGVDGIVRHYGFAPVPGSDWIAFTGISAQETAAPYYDLFRASIAISFGVIAAVLFLAVALSRRLVRPIVELSEAASRVAASGSASPVHASGPKEIASLTSSLNAMVAKLLDGESRLAESEERHRTMLETSNDGVWAADANGITTYVNARFAEMTGYSAEEMIGQPALDFIPGSRLREGEAHSASRRAGQGAVFEFPITRRDGSEMWALFSATPTYRGGVYAGAFAMISDLTARREAEIRLAESEERYRTIVETAGEGLWLLDADMKITFVNQRVEEILGFTPQEMLGRRVLDFVSPMHLKAARTQQANRRKGRRDTFEMAFLRKDRTVTWTRITSTALMRGSDFRGAVALITDITESRRAAERLRKSEEALRHAQRDAAIGSWSWNVRTGAWEASDEYCRMLGLDKAPQASATDDLWRFAHPDDWEHMEGTLNRATAARAARFEVNARMIRLNGETFHSWIRARVEYGMDGAPLNVHGTTQDVTQLEQTRIALEQSREELRALSDRLMIAIEEERKEVARELHDDLGQALTAIKIDLDGLASRITDESDRTLIERARRASLDTIRAVQRLSSNLRPVALDDLGFSAAVEHEARVFEQRTGIECEVSILNEEIVRSSRAKLTLFRITQEALTNIARHSGASRAEIRLRWDGRDILLEVRDNGKGIPSEQIASAASIGIVGMRERTAMIGGVLAVAGVPNRGTIISARIPAERME